jgi:hypothetical protein
VKLYVNEETKGGIGQQMCKRVLIVKPIKRGKGIGKQVAE